MFIYSILQSFNRLRTTLFEGEVIPTFWSCYSGAGSCRIATILVPIALFTSLSRRGLGTRNEGLWRHFQVLDSGTSGHHVWRRNVSINCMRLSMVVVEAWFDESLENVSVSVGQKEAKRNTVVLKKEQSYLYWHAGFGKSFIFQLLLIVFLLRSGETESFILFVRLEMKIKELSRFNVRLRSKELS